MRKRTLVSALATALAGLSLTAGSAAAAELVDPLGPVPTGSEIYLVSENMTKTNGPVAYPWICDRVGVLGEVTQNSEGTVTMTSLGTGEAEGCRYVQGGNEYPITLEPTLQSMSLSASGNTTSMKFVEIPKSKAIESCITSGALGTSYGWGGIAVSGQVKRISGCYGGSITGVVNGSFTLESAMGPVEVLP